MGEPDLDPQLQRKPELVSAYMERLDAEAAKARNRCHRLAERYHYRVRALPVELHGPTGSVVRHTVPSRNISRHGVGFLVGHFVYPGTRCVLKLVSVHNQMQTVEGKVVRCRYLTGSGCLYEVGVKFDRAIDVSMFNRDATPVCVLLVASDEAVQTLVRHFVKSVNVRLDVVQTGAAGVEAGKTVDFDLVFVDIDLPDQNGLDVARKLRDAGVLIPVVALTSWTGPEVAARCLNAGCSGHIPKPLSSDSVLGIVERMAPTPLVSSLMHDSAMAPLIDQFVGRLPEMVKRIQDAVRDRDIATLSATMRTIKGQAGSYGFDVLSVTAQDIEQMVINGAEFGSVQSRIGDLIRWCRSVRPSSPTSD